MNINDFKSRLKGGNLSGWYIFAGEEDYLKKFYLSELRRAVLGEEDLGLGVFNHVVFDALDMDIGSLREAIETPPMMQEYKLIEWRFANLSAMKDSEIKTFSEKIFSLREDYPSSIFAIMTTEDGFDVGTEKRPSKLFKIFSEGFDILSFPKSTDTQLLSWLKKHFDAEGISVERESLNTMLFRVGRSMEILNNEVIKLSSFLKANGRAALTAADVELVCPSSAESDAFAIQNAVIEGNAAQAFRALTDMKNRRTEPQIIIGMLAKTYSSLSSVALLADEGLGFDEIQKITGLASYPLGLYMKAYKKLGTAKISKSLKALIKADASSKQGGIMGYQAIEMFITQNL